MTTNFLDTELSELKKLGYSRIKTSNGPKMSYYNGYDEILLYKNENGDYTFDYTNKNFSSEIQHYDSFSKLLKRIKLK